MKNKLLYGALGLEALACAIIAAVTAGASGLANENILTFPFAQLGDMLRGLSLANPTGNAVALALYVLIGVLPVMYLLKRLIQRRSRIEDSLLAVMSFFLFFMMYRMINPAILAEMFPAYTGGSMVDMGKVALSVTVYSIVAVYIVARILRSLHHSGTVDLLRRLRIMVIIFLAVLVYLIFGAGLNELIAAQRAADSKSGYLIVIFIISQVPSIMTLIVFVKVIHLIDELAQENFSDAVIIRTGSLARFSAASVLSILASITAKNILQLIFSKDLAVTDYTVQIPIFSLAAVLVVFFLSRYFAESKKLKTENEMFI